MAGNNYNSINIDNGENKDSLLLGVSTLTANKTNVVVSVAPPPFHVPPMSNQSGFGFMPSSASPSSSSLIPAEITLMSKDMSMGAYDDLGELTDQAFSLYFQGPDPPSSQGAENYELRLPNTLNIFPSQPMHVNLSATAENPIVSPDRPEGSNRLSLPSIDLASPTDRAEGSNRLFLTSIELARPPDRAEGSNGLSLPSIELASLPMLEGSGGGIRIGSTSTAGNRDDRTLDAKTLRRLAQNREAARKSRLRKKAYIQQLEASRVKLIQLEQKVARAKARGVCITETGSLVSADHGYPLSMTKITPEAAAFELEYSRWVEDGHKIISEVRAALEEDHSLAENELRKHVDVCFAHYRKMVNLKTILAKTDALHLTAGVCWTPLERCFMWIGGFRPSHIITLIMSQVGLLTELQVLAMIALRQSTQEAEEALSMGMEALHQTVSNILCFDALLYPANPSSCTPHMTAAISKLSSLEIFVQQADNLRSQTMHRLYQTLTIRQVAKCFVVAADYFHRLRTLSSLWLGRPAPRQG